MIVMEPVKGGNLVNLPDEARSVFDGLHGGSYASYALRFAAGFPGIMTVLSGMGNMEQMEDIAQQTTHLTEFDESLVRRWIKQITIWDDHITVELKSGVSIDVDV